MDEEKAVDVGSSHIEEISANVPEEDGYDINSLRGPQSIADLGRDSLALHHVFGIDIHRRGGIYLIEDDMVIYAVSAAVIFESTLSGKKEYLIGIDDGGIGCITVHPSK